MKIIRINHCPECPFSYSIPKGATDEMAVCGHMNVMEYAYADREIFPKRIPAFCPLETAPTVESSTVALFEAQLKEMETKFKPKPKAKAKAKAKPKAKAKKPKEKKT